MTPDQILLQKISLPFVSKEVFLIGYSSMSILPSLSFSSNHRLQGNTHLNN